MFFQALKKFLIKFYTLIPFFLFFLIFFYLFFSSLDFLKGRSLFELIFSSHWKPLKGDFGFFTFWFSSFYVTALSAIIFIPVGLLISVYISEYANRKIKDILKPFFDVLSAIPSVVFGLWGFTVIVPLVSKIGKFLDIPTSGYSILSASLVLSLMVLPFMITLCLSIFEMVPFSLKESVLSLGATKFEMVEKVLIPQCKKGIIASIFLSLGRAIGETMAVMMVVGCTLRVPKTPFDPAYPIPALIANEFGEMMSISSYKGALLFSAFLLNLIVLIFHFIFRRAFLRKS